MLSFAMVPVFRSIPTADITLKIATISNIKEVINLWIVLATSSFLCTLCLRPMPLVVAHFAYIAIHSCGMLTVALGSAVFCFQLCYVAKFDFLFTLDPHELRRTILYVLGSVIVVPNAIAGIYNTVLDTHAVAAVALFTQKEYEGDGGIRFLQARE
jgi:hypothetical protein